MEGTPYNFFVQWHLTERCNLRCRHCYQQVAPEDLDLREIRQGVDNIKNATEGWAASYAVEISPSFHFTGGEPVLRTDLFDILDYVRSQGFSISLMSNGTLIKPEVARRIRDAGVQDVQVSLDGLEAVHDSIRGKGSFKRALTGIENLLAEEVDANVNLTLSKLNAEQIEGLVNLAKEMGLSAVSFSRLVPCGRGEELGSQILTPVELARIYNNLSEFTDSKVSVISRDPLMTVARLKEEIPDVDFPVGGCAAGVFGVTVTADGSIMPCRRMDLSIGNIRDVSFRELWIESPVLQQLRNRQSYHGGCQSCRYWAVCRGCRAVALAFARSIGEEDYLGPDPQCPSYEPRTTG